MHGAMALAERALTAARARQIAVPGGVPTAAQIHDLAGEALDIRQKIATLDHDLAVLLSGNPDGALIRSLPG